MFREDTVLFVKGTTHGLTKYSVSATQSLTPLHKPILSLHMHTF